MWSGFIDVELFDWLILGLLKWDLICGVVIDILELLINSGKNFEVEIIYG